MLTEDPSVLPCEKERVHHLNFYKVHLSYKGFIMKPWISNFELKQKSSECPKMESDLVIFLENFGFHMGAFRKFLQGMGDSVCCGHQTRVFSDWRSI